MKLPIGKSTEARRTQAPSGAVIHFQDGVEGSAAHPAACERLYRCCGVGLQLSQDRHQTSRPVGPLMTPQGALRKRRAGSRMQGWRRASRGQDPQLTPSWTIGGSAPDPAGRGPSLPAAGAGFKAAAAQSRLQADVRAESCVWTQVRSLGKLWGFWRGSGCGDLCQRLQPSLASKFSWLY